MEDFAETDGLGDTRLNPISSLHTRNHLSAVAVGWNSCARDIIAFSPLRTGFRQTYNKPQPSNDFMQVFMHYTNACDKM